MAWRTACWLHQPMLTARIMHSSRWLMFLHTIMYWYPFMTMCAHTFVHHQPSVGRNAATALVGLQEGGDQRSIWKACLCVGGPVSFLLLFCAARCACSISTYVCVLYKRNDRAVKQCIRSRGIRAQHTPEVRLSTLVGFLRLRRVYRILRNGSSIHLVHLPYPSAAHCVCCANLAGP